MAKCDICGTSIPLGSQECPNCGYRVKKKSTIHSSTLEFDHIKEETKMPSFDHIDLKPKYLKNDSWKQTQSIQMTIRVIKGVFFGAIAFILFFLFMAIYFSYSKYF